MRKNFLDFSGGSIFHSECRALAQRVIYERVWIWGGLWEWTSDSLRQSLNSLSLCRTHVHYFGTGRATSECSRVFINRGGGETYFHARSSSWNRSRFRLCTCLQPKSGPLPVSLKTPTTDVLELSRLSGSGRLRPCDKVHHSAGSFLPLGLTKSCL